MRVPIIMRKRYNITSVLRARTPPPPPPLSLGAMWKHRLVCEYSDSKNPLKHEDSTAVPPATGPTAVLIITNSLISWLVQVEPLLFPH